MNKSCLIITSCIYPFSSFVALKDPITRESLHVEGLKRWIIESSFESIIICDNSNYVYSQELVKLASSNNKNLEILSFSGDHESGLKYGKGFGEGELMKFVMMNSKSIKHYKSFFKVTGKLFVENFALIENFTNADFIFSIPINFLNSKKSLDLVYTTFYYAKVESFKLYLMDAFLDVRDNDGVYLEHVYASVLKEQKKINRKLKIKAMTPIPLVIGVSGSTGNFYYRRHAIKEKILNILIKTFFVKKF